MTARLVRRRVGVALLALACVASTSSPPTPPSVVFILLDTTRADRLSAWGNPRATTPTLDRLARDGVWFRRHYADAHATRPSMPQLMSGRYYHHNVLAAFQTDAHPREMTFARPDPTATLLPAVLRANGYATAAISAHTWVTAESELGRAFDRVELLPFAAADGHGDANPLVDRAIASWRERDRTHPFFLYLHFMDMHIPRRLPEGEPRFPQPGYDWRARFRATGEPAFDPHRRAWSRHDARDFTAADRAHYAAVYDTRLQYADEHIARLVAAIRADDPELRDTIVVVTADHGEELGEDGRVEHPPSLADGVQHVPWIVAGGPVASGQRCDRVTEHVDVLPSLLALLGLPLPPGVTTDGRARLGTDGRLAAPCGGDAAYYAFEDYRAVRRHRYLLVERVRGSLEARCDGDERVYHLDGPHRRAASGSAVARHAERLRRLLHARLDAPERTFRDTRYDAPARSFLVPTDFWRIGDSPPLRCVRLDEDTPRGALGGAGWLWSGRGVTAVGAEAAPLAVHVDVPPGTYAVDAAATPIAPPPWLLGYSRWRRKTFLPERPSQYLPLGAVGSSGGTLDVALPAAVAAGHHVLGLRLTPPGARAGAAGVDDAQHERLKALGYVQ